jgi:hypothetical protein
MSNRIEEIGRLTQQAMVATNDEERMLLLRKVQSLVESVDLPPLEEVNVAASAPTVVKKEMEDKKGAVVEPMVVWKDGEYVSGWDGGVEMMQSKTDATKLANCFRVAGLKLPTDAVLLALTFPKFPTMSDADITNGSKVYEWSKRAKGLLSGIGAMQYVENSHYKMVTMATSLVSKGDELPESAGGTKGKMKENLSEEELRERLQEHANGVVRKMKEICQVIYNALMKALEDELNARVTMESMSLNVATRFTAENPSLVDETDDTEPGCNTDPYALWKLIHRMYRWNEDEQLLIMTNQVQKVCCESNTKIAVLRFYAELNSIAQKLKALKSEKEAGVIYLIDMQRRHGLTAKLIEELKREERTTNNKKKPAEMAEWAEKAVEAIEETEPGNTVSAVGVGKGASQPPHGAATPGAASSKARGAEKTPGNWSGYGRMHCAYHDARTHSLENCKSVPSGWKKGDFSKFVERNTPEKQRRLKERNECESKEKESGKGSAPISALTNATNSSSDNKTISSSYSKSKENIDGFDYEGEEKFQTIGGKKCYNICVVSAVITQLRQIYVAAVSWVVSALGYDGAANLDSAAMKDDIERWILLDSGSPVHIAPNDKLAIEGTKKKLRWRVRLNMADRTSTMWADEICDIIIGKHIIIKNVLIVPQMKNVIISESKLKEQNLIVYEKILGVKGLYRISNMNDAMRGDVINVIDEPLLTIRQEGKKIGGGLFQRLVGLDETGDTRQAAKLSNGEVFNRANGERDEQEAQIASALAVTPETGVVSSV